MPTTLRRARLPVAHEDLAESMARLCANKVCATAGEVDADALGWAAAIHQGKRLLGSLSVVLARSHAPADPKRVADQLLRAALRIEGRLQSPS